MRIYAQFRRISLTHNRLCPPNIESPAAIVQASNFLAKLLQSWVCFLLFCRHNRFNTSNHRRQQRGINRIHYQTQSILRLRRTRSRQRHSMSEFSKRIWFNPLICRRPLASREKLWLQRRRSDKQLHQRGPNCAC